MMSGEKLKCPLCGEGVLEDDIVDHDTYIRKGARNVKITIKNLAIKRCTKCKEDFVPKEAVEQLQTEKHKRRGLLTLEQLKEIRTKLGYTQEEMAELLGLGKKTYFRWEKGLFLQNKAMDRYVRLIAENPENLKILKRINEESRKG